MNDRVHKCPSGLELPIPDGLCERAEALFAQLANILDAEQRLMPGDFIGLGQLAQLQVDVADLQEVIRKEGLARTTLKNQTARRIEVSTLNQHRVHLTKLLSYFEFTPKAHGPRKEEEEDVLTQMLRARGENVGMG